jgi:hypothetical protein
MVKLIRNGALTYMIHCHQMEISASELVNIDPPKIQKLIQKNKKVFQDLPLELPPKREIEHIIEVKSESNPVNINPYQYPHHQK